MTHWKLILAYDGTPYNGWQVQPGLPTIQGTLADALHHITGERVLPQGSGRTDTGVHALAQVASCSLASPIPPANLHRALNRCLPPSIRILAADPIASSFHARHSATSKTYEYRIFPLKARPEKIQESYPSQLNRGGSDANLPDDPDRICPPILAPYVWPCPWPLDLVALNQAANHILGTHDFTTFAASDPDQTTRDTEATDTPAAPRAAIRTMHHSQWRAHEDLLVYTITGSGFLHHMVRNLVGTFVQAGAHRLNPDAIPDLLAARNRSAAGPTAPATGLFLVQVDYPKPENSPPTTAL